MAEMANQPLILVVEDDPSMLEIISFLLEDEGYRVLPASDGQAGLATLERNRPDLIISDIMMPGMDGFDFYQQARSRPDWGQIPFIFLTAKGQRADIRRGMGLGADDYLTKPFEPEELLTAVRVRLARAAESQAAIRQASADLSARIIQTLTHEFRTPLALVVGYTDLLEATGQEMSEEERQAILEGLHVGTQRLIGLVEDFLLLNRLSSGSLAAEIKQAPRMTLEPDWVVSLVVEQFREQAARRNVTLLLRLGAGHVTVGTSQRDLTEIVRKLVDNAVKFSKSEGGEVIVSTWCENNSWILEVADSGIGIRPDALPWIFDAFRQVDRERLEQQGTGVGLAIVHGLIELYGGEVAVQSMPDQGSVFTVHLPLVSP